MSTNWCSMTKSARELKSVQLLHTQRHITDCLYRVRVQIEGDPSSAKLFLTKALNVKLQSKKMWISRKVGTKTLAEQFSFHISPASPPEV